jgi:hypothetical protein
MEQGITKGKTKMTNKFTTTSSEPVTPDTLMEHFHGKGLKSIIVFTVAVHAVVLLGSSVPFLWRKAVGANPSAMSEEERIDKAVREATAELRTIAETYNLSPQDISQRFSGSGTRPVPVAEAAPAQPAAAPAPVGEQPEPPKSAIEKELGVTKEGPAVPPVEDDIF